MNCWVSPPAVVIPEPCQSQDAEQVDGWYRRICMAFAEPITPKRDDFILPRAMSLNAEDLAACAIHEVLVSAIATKMPPVEILVDCRTSAAVSGPAPTYMLCAKSNLRSVQPLSLSGQAGTEMAYGLYFARQLMRARVGTAVVSTVQRMVPPDGRLVPNLLPLADAAAAVIVSSSPISGGFGLRALELSWQEPGCGESMRTLLESVLARAKIDRKAIDWTITHRFSHEFDKQVQDCLPTAAFLVRDQYPESNFGCADPLISLHSIFCLSPTPPSGIGILWIRGLYGALAAAILEPTKLP